MLSQVIINILITASLYLLIAQSFTVIYYPTKFFHLAHGAIITFGAYLSYYFYISLNFPILISVAVSISISSGLGLLCNILVYEPMKKRNAKSFEFLIASIGIYVILQNIISVWFSDSPKNIFTGVISAGHNFLGGYITNIQLFIFFSAIISFVFLYLFLSKTKTGINIAAISKNEELTNIYGIEPRKIIRFSFLIGSAIAAFAGFLAGADTKMLPTMGFNLFLYGIVAMIIGGVGSITGLILGSLLVATCQQLAAFYIGQVWIDAATYIILILFLIIKPLGFSGNLLHKTEI